MKKQAIILTVIVTLIVAACKKEPKLDKNGLTKDITDMVPQYVLNGMQGLGMPFHGGDSPPILTQGQLAVTYRSSPHTLKSSNIPGDTLGKIYSDYTVTFSNQNNHYLTIDINYANGPESGNGLSGYIVGKGSLFSVFFEINATHSGGTNAKLVHVISGTLSSGGIENFHFSNFMIDDYGDPQNVWINNGGGRVFYDSNGFSEKL